MITPEQIEVDGLYCRANKVRRVIKIFKEYSSAFGHEIDVIETEWVVGKLKGGRNILWVGQLCAWAEFKTDESRLPRHEEAICGL